MEMKEAGRANQRSRTRKDLLQAAARLLKQGRKPSLEDVAEEALVSRATAYRYFPSVEALLLEAPLDTATPGPSLFANDASSDPVARLQRADRALDKMVYENEAQLRLMLANALERIARGEAEAPARQNRRAPLIEAALAPVKDEIDPVVLQRLRHALALVIGTESMVVFKDVLQLGEEEARAVKDWAIEALVKAARK